MAMAMRRPEPGEETFLRNKLSFFSFFLLFSLKDFEELLSSPSRCRSEPVLRSRERLLTQFLCRKAPPDAVERQDFFSFNALKAQVGGPEPMEEWTSAAR